jgi:uncharacterized secreted protein with C-terminal beta-propeller domain
MRRTMATAMAILLSACSFLKGGDTTDNDGVSASNDSNKSGNPVNQLVAALGLEGFSSCDQVLSYLQDNALSQVTAWGLGGGGFFLQDMRMGIPISPAATAESADGAGANQQYSTTNLQEVGVDEPDMVKTDGRILVAIAQGKLFVVDVTGEPALVGSLQLGEIAPQNLFLFGDQVLVIGAAPTLLAQERLFGTDPVTGGADAGVAIMPDRMWWNPMATIAQIDLSDPTAPEKVAELTIEGSVLAARMIDDSIRLVTSSISWSLPFMTPDQILAQRPVWQQDDPGAWENAERIALSQNRSVILNSTIEDWFPRFTLTDEAGLAQTHDGTLVDCNSIAHPEEFSGLGITSILTFDLSQGLSPVDAFGLVSDSQTIYASPGAIYVATQQWRDWNVVPENQWDQVAGITTTTIHRFDATDPSRVEFTGSGEVLGWLYSQWAMSEKDGLLRVASTTQSPWWGFREGTTQSMVTILEQGDGTLETVGQVAGLGIDEQIYAVRFVGDAGYVVTFRQTDPLYVIDLREPAQPQIAGELKIPGYSAYLHPIGDGLLVGVGQDANLQGQAQGTQVAVFDVSDPTSPSQVDKLTLPGAYSQAEWDHHAFLYWPATETLVIPVQQTKGVEWWNGALAVHAGADGVHSLAEIEQPGYVYRTLVVGTNLLSLSDMGIQLNDLESFEKVGWIGF